MTGGAPLDPARAAGRLIVAGCEGLEPPAELLEAIRAGELGGVILFARNYESPAQVAALVQRLLDAAPWPLWVCVDQEGGRVRRFAEPFLPLPPLRALGRTGDAELARRVGAALARELAAVGVSWELAPVLDVDTNPINPVIGDRALHGDPAVVARLGVSLARGIEGEGVLSCGKHFPGHGDTLHDSHLTLPVLPHDLRRLRDVELVPFSAYARAGLAAVMTAHVLFPDLDPERPATLSPPVLRILREELGFRGLVVSDDLEMKAVADRYEIEEIVERGVGAGIDVFLVCHRLDLARRAAAAARRLAGGAGRAAIAASLARIDAAAIRFALPRRPLSPREIRAVVGAAEHRRLLDELRS